MSGKVVVKRVEIYGVAYSRLQNGAACPRCKTPKAQVLRTMPWEGEGTKSQTRLRYHWCRICGASFKSLEEE